MDLRWPGTPQNSHADEHEFFASQSNKALKIVFGAIYPPIHQALVAIMTLASLPSDYLDHLDQSLKDPQLGGLYFILQGDFNVRLTRTGGLAGLGAPEQSMLVNGLRK